MNTDSYYEIEMPRIISGLERGEATVNEIQPPGLGVSIPYRGKGIQATVYIYDLGYEEIPDGPESDLVISQLWKTVDDVQSALDQGIYEAAQLKDKFGTGSPSRGREFLCAELELRQNGLIEDSYIYLTGFKKKFIKVRITMPKDSQLDHIARDFADEIAKEFWPDGRLNK